MSKLLIQELSKELKYDIKQSISFLNEDIDTPTLNTLKEVLGTDNTLEVIKRSFTVLAIEELNRVGSILEFPCNDFIERLRELEIEEPGDTKIEIPIWMVMAVTYLIHEGYQTSIECTEDVINTLLVLMKQRLNYLWQPYPHGKEFWGK